MNDEQQEAVLCDLAIAIALQDMGVEEVRRSFDVDDDGQLHISVLARGHVPVDSLTIRHRIIVDGEEVSW